MYITVFKIIASIVFKCLRTLFYSLYGKGQIKPKADWRDIDSPKKRICFVCFFAFHSKKKKSVPLFFGRIYGAPKLLSVLSDL